jgi:5'-nucleotidase
VTSARPFFLISNDDGVHAPGIAALAAAAAVHGDYMIVAPHEERSGAGQGLSLSVPLRLEQLQPNVFAASGTPADCMLLALNRLVPRRPDFVLSGINRGSNIGQDTLYSGTVAAAMEGAVHKIPALSFSLRGHRHDDPRAYDEARVVIERLLANEAVLAAARQGVVNVNIPNVPVEKMRGIKVTALGRRNYDTQIVAGVDPRGRPYYWIGGGGDVFEPLPGTDCVWLAQDYVTLTVLQPEHVAVGANAALAAQLDAQKVL